MSLVVPIFVRENKDCECIKVGVCIHTCLVANFHDCLGSNGWTTNMVAYALVYAHEFVYFGLKD